MYTNNQLTADEGSTPGQAGIPGPTGDGNPVQRSQSSVALWRVIDELQPVLGSLGLGQREHTLRITLKKLSKGELELAGTLPLVIEWLYDGNDTACEFARRLEALLPPEEEVDDEEQSPPSRAPILQHPMAVTPPAASPPMPVREALPPKTAAETSVAATAEAVENADAGVPAVAAPPYVAPTCAAPPCEAPPCAAPTSDAVPQRIHRERTKGWRMPANTIVVSRPSIWGNPFVVDAHGSKEECVRKFEQLLEGTLCESGGPSRKVQREYLTHAKKHLGELRGKNLACWCKPGEPCHANVLLKLANSADGIESVAVPASADDAVAPAPAAPAAPAGAKLSPKATAGGKIIIQNIIPKPGTAEPPKVEPVQYGSMKQPDEHPLLAELRVSRYSRSYMTPPTDESVEVMVSSIMEYGLINALILAADPDAPGVYEVVAGEHRRQALLRLRPDGRLQPDEYRVISIPANDRRLAEVSMEENKGRKEPSPYELALLADHLIEDEKFTQEEVAKLMGKFQPTINGLQGLARNAKVLPEAWRKDLRKPPASKPVIRLAHWLAVKPHLDDDGSMPAKVRKICEEAASAKWSVAELKNALGPSKKREKSPITDTSNLSELKQPEIETPGVQALRTPAPKSNSSNSPSASPPAAATTLRSWAEGLSKIADEMHEHQSVHEENVRAVQHAVEADLACQKNEEAA